MVTLSVVSCFATKDVGTYGYTFLLGFENFWPKNVDLHLYVENDCKKWLPKPHELKHSYLHSLTKECEDAYAFGARYAHDPRANGKLHGEYSMHWDARKFAFKVYTVIAQAMKNKSRYLLWLDADTVTHAPVSLDFILSFLPEGQAVAWLNRDHKYPECGFLLFDTEHPCFLEIMQNMHTLYETGRVLELEQTHDSWVWQHVVNEIVKAPVANMSGQWSRVNHPFIHVLGSVMDHLKGVSRKQNGRSFQRDLKTERKEAWWHEAS